MGNKATYGTIVFAIMALNPISNVIVLIYRQKLDSFYRYQNLSEFLLVSL